MIKKTLIKTVLYAIFGVASVIIFSSCFESVEVSFNNAQTPDITSQPTVEPYYLIEKEVEISVTASISDGGELSYQWYENSSNSTTGGNPIKGETDKSYEPPTDTAGTKYYYVVVKNTNDNAVNLKEATKTSSIVKIEVLEALDFLVAELGGEDNAEDDNNDTVTLKKNVTLTKNTTIPTNTTLDLGSYNLTINSTLIIEKDAEISGTGKIIINSGGKVEMEQDTEFGGVTAEFKSGAILQLRNSGDPYDAEHIGRDNAVLNLTSGTITVEKTPTLLKFTLDGAVIVGQGEPTEYDFNLAIASAEYTVKSGASLTIRNGREVWLFTDGELINNGTITVESGCKIVDNGGTLSGTNPTGAGNWPGKTP